MFNGSRKPRVCEANGTERHVTFQLSTKEDSRSMGPCWHYFGSAPGCANAFTFSGEYQDSCLDGARVDVGEPAKKPQSYAMRMQPCPCLFDLGLIGARLFLLEEARWAAMLLRTTSHWNG